jgi:hypothetical protein
MKKIIPHLDAPDSDAMHRSAVSPKSRNRGSAPDLLDEIIEASFPASDPSSFPSARIGAPDRYGL